MASGIQPLYQQVYDTLVNRIVTGKLLPGESLPSEQALAKELGVSQGTIRKALDVMAAEKLVERRQGKGTYVNKHTQEQSLSRFFRFTNAQGDKLTPSTELESITKRPATKLERKKLLLYEDTDIVDISRVRSINNVKTIIENIILPAGIFPGIEKREEMPNALYSIFQSEYSISVVSTKEEISAIAANANDASQLNVKPGTPLLQIDRIAVSIDGHHVEWRRSRCDTSNLIYDVRLS